MQGAVASPRGSRVDGVGAAEPEASRRYRRAFLVLADASTLRPPVPQRRNRCFKSKLHRQVRLRRRPVPGPLFGTPLGKASVAATFVRRGATRRRGPGASSPASRLVEQRQLARVQRAQHFIKFRPHVVGCCHVAFTRLSMSHRMTSVDGTSACTGAGPHVSQSCLTRPSFAPSRPPGRDERKGHGAVLYLLPLLRSTPGAAPSTRRTRP